MRDPFAKKLETVNPTEIIRSLSSPLEDPDSIAQKALTRLEDEVFVKHSEIVSSMGDWADIPEDGTRPPGWDEKRYRVALAATKPKKDAPVGLQLSAQIHGNIMKARAASSRAPDTVNIMVVELPVGAGDYPVRVIKAEDR